MKKGVILFVVIALILIIGFSGCTQISDHIEGFQELKAYVSVDKIEVDINEIIQFYGDGTGGTPPYTFYWDFGDGSISNVRNPTHSYSDEGLYTCILVVEDRGYETAQDIGSITVIFETTELTLQANANQTTTKVGKQVSFYATASGGREPYSYLWDFGAQGTSNQRNPKFIFKQAGDYLCTVTVTDYYETTVEKIVEIKVESPLL